MRYIRGAPATRLGLLLRLLQTILAATAIKLIILSYPDLNFSTHRYFITSMVLQVIWSGSMAIIDVYALTTRQRLESHTAGYFIAVGDFVAGLASLGAGAVLVAIIVVYGCRHFSTFPCGLYQLTAALAFLCWLTTSVSSLIALWIAASGD